MRINMVDLQRSATVNTMDTFMWPGAMMAIVLLLIAFEWKTADKKKGGVNVVDRKKMFGMFVVGLIMTAMVWFVQDRF